MNRPIDDRQIPSDTLDYGVRSAFLAKLDDDRKLRIFDLTTRAASVLHRWAARYPFIRRVRVWPLSLSIAASCPFADVPALVTMAKVSLWVFTIDDLFDEETVPVAELQRRVTRYKDLLDGKPPDNGQDQDTLALALQDIHEDLKRYPLCAALNGEWTGAVAGTLDAMMREQAWRVHYRGAPPAPLPTYQEYLRYGRYSIGGPPHIWAALITIGDESVLERLSLLKALEQSASTCIRLANDLQSYRKEIAEDKLNSIVILRQEALQRGVPAGMALDAAGERVRQEIDTGLARCSALQQQVCSETGHPERAIADVARFVCDFYVHHDYHTFTIKVGRA